MMEYWYCNCKIRTRDGETVVRNMINPPEKDRCSTCGSKKDTSSVVPKEFASAVRRMERKIRSFVWPFPLPVGSA
jgi:hypothetical protein